LEHNNLGQAVPKVRNTSFRRVYFLLTFQVTIPAAFAAAEKPWQWTAPTHGKIPLLTTNEREYSSSSLLRSDLLMESEGRVGVVAVQCWLLAHRLLPISDGGTMRPSIQL